MSTRLMIGLMFAYAVITITAAIEGKWYRALYFVGAIIISAGVLGMSND